MTLEQAARELVAVVNPEWSGDLVEALSAIAEALSAIAEVLAGGFDTGVHDELRAALGCKEPPC